VLVGILVALLPWEPAGVWLAGRFDLARSRRAERRAMAPQLALARRLALSYEAVAADPKAHAGEPVAWCVDHPGAGVAFLEGRPSQPLVWSNDAAVPVTGSKGRCAKVLAVVEGAGPDGVRLRFVGQP
jgi:hypothetical protein